MNSIISPSQSAFLKGRNLVDGVLVVNELVDYAKRAKKEFLIFKVDFEKAYDSMDMACDFLSCSKGKIPFLYLGLPVGANGRSMSTWEVLVESLNRKLNTWGHKYINFGGRIVLLNSVLNSIPIFYLTFLRMPVKVWKMMVQIQREFMWGGVGRGRKINWVKWPTVCQSKRKGGLGVKDIRVMNVSLLAKWRWMLLDGENSLWKEVLEEKYGPCGGGIGRE